MVELEELEKKFKQNKWDKYLNNLYKFIINGKDVNILIECIEKIEEFRARSETKSVPHLTLEDVKKARVKYDPVNNTYDVESLDDIDINVGGCSEDYEPFGEGNSFGCRKKNNRNMKK